MLCGTRLLPVKEAVCMEKVEESVCSAKSNLPIPLGEVPAVCGS